MTYPLIDLPTSGNYNSYEKIKKLSVSDRMDNILQHSRLLMPKDCINIPDNWLEFEIFDLIKYPFNLDKFELYNEQIEQICVCKFVKNYEKKCRLNGYFSKPISYNYNSEIFGTMSRFSIFRNEKYKKLSNKDRLDNLVISDTPKTDDANSEVVAREGGLKLVHSPAAHVLTNDDLEDTDSSSGNSRGESL